METWHQQQHWLEQRTAENGETICVWLAKSSIAHTPHTWNTKPKLRSAQHIGYRRLCERGKCSICASIIFRLCWILIAMKLPFLFQIPKKKNVRKNNWKWHCGQFFPSVECIHDFRLAVRCRDNVSFSSSPHTAKNYSMLEQTKLRVWI